MKTIEEQLEIINTLIGNDHIIKVKEDGFLSRGFVVDNGRLVFKFPRNKDVSYKTEIENLNFINNLGLNINLQKVAFINDGDEYLGIFGVLGNSLEEVVLSEEEKLNVGKQLGLFLKQLHKAKGQKGEVCTLNAEINAWQNRIKNVNDFIVKTFDFKQQEIINKLIFEYMPNKLNELGENLVFSHGDLGDGNIFVDNNNKVGVIDFNSSGLLDEGGDFMDINSDIILSAMLDAYGADEVLREKVEIRRDIRPFIVLKPYLTRNDSLVMEDLVKKIIKTINKYSYLIKK